MPDEPNPTPSPTPTPTPPLPNDQAARNPDGSLKDQQASPSPSPEPKPEPKADDKPKEDPKPEPKKDDKPVLTGAPEKYAEFKLPEGAELSEEVMGKAQELFKELNLSQEGAQRAVDFHTAELAKAANAGYEQYTQMRKDWRNEMAQDKEIGDGKSDLKPEVKQGLANVIAALPEKLQGPFKEAMIFTGAGDNPAFVKAFFALSPRFTEGKPITPSGPSEHGQGGPAAKTGAQSMYPNLPSENSPRAG